MVIVHGGHEHFQLPSPRMQETYRFFIEAGADAVVNHHQHCFSGYEVYNGKPIFYGLGNFLFDEKNLRNSTWNQGYMVKLDFYDENVGLTLYPYTQCNNVVAVNLLTAEERGIFDKRLFELNEIIGNESLLKEKVQEYYERGAKGELAILEPYRGKVFSKLYDLGLLPRFVNGEKLSSMLNHIYCESHRDKLIDTLIKKNNVGNKQSI